MEDFVLIDYCWLILCRPPGGCLQFHTAEVGRITTFNFNAMAGTHLPNQE